MHKYKLLPLFLLTIFNFTFSAAALTPGEAAGTITIDNSIIKATSSLASSTENLFDDKKQDTIIAVTDHKLEGIDPADRIATSLKARQGEFTAFILRIDGTKLINVVLNYKDLAGEVILPGAWFEFSVSKSGEGTLKLVKREWEGHTYGCDFKFMAGKFIKPVVNEVIEPTPTIAPTPTLAKASTSSIDNKRLTSMLIGAIMQQDEDQAVKIAKIGIDPDSKDDYGVPILNWAVMSCLPKVVKALVNLGADLTYERSPGLTIMAEAGACPEAAKILKEAGAK